MPIARMSDSRQIWNIETIGKEGKYGWPPNARRCIMIDAPVCNSKGFFSGETSAYRVVRNEQHAANHCVREYIRATMDSSRPVDGINHRRADRQLASKSTVPAVSQLCCRSQRDHVHRQGWRAGPPDDAPGWRKVCGDWAVYEASLGIAFVTGRVGGRFILISRKLTNVGPGFLRMQTRRALEAQIPKNRRNSIGSECSQIIWFSIPASQFESTKGVCS
jgi:hypothetical protein